MKVRGFKARVQLSEEQLEHVERKPGFSLTPVLAVSIWVVSMLAAAAIHFAWSPFGGGASEAESDRNSTGSAARVQPLRAPETNLPGQARAARYGAREAAEPAPAETSEPETEAPVPDASAQQTAVQVPRDRKIRGSYAGAGRDWLAGW